LNPRQVTAAEFHVLVQQSVKDLSWGLEL
jgi:hypothetical protein